MNERVAVVLHEPLLGGATTSLLRVLPPELERRGWGFSFWVPGRGAAEAELRRRGYEVLVTSERMLRFSLPSSLRQPPGPVKRLASSPASLGAAPRAWLAGLRDAALVHANTLLALPELAVLPRSAGRLWGATRSEMLPDGPRGLLIGPARRACGRDRGRLLGVRGREARDASA